MKNNTSGHDSAAIEFLELVRPGGPWTLAAKTKRGFVCETTNSPANWLSSHVGDQYFLPAKPIVAVQKKPSKEEIESTEWLWVDIDPRAGEELAAERERILALLTTNLPGDVLPPTLIIDSGRGYWGFWRLVEPAGIEAEDYNRGLELAFDADACHNIDRVARLPGTLNSKTGELSSVVVYNDCNTHSLSDFNGVPTNPATEEKQIVVSPTVRRISSVDELDVPDRVKVIIVQGRDPDKPKGVDNSRSAWLFDCLCQLFRAEVPDDVVYGVITDPDFGISASVRDKGGNMEKYALRQMTRAKEHAIDPMLATLNEQHAVVTNIGGKVRVMDTEARVFQSFEDFRNRYSNRFVDVGTPEKPSIKPAGKWWLEHPRRREYKSVVFAPGRDVGKQVYNLWQGFAVESAAGDCDSYWRHVHENICADNQAHFDYLRRWMARGVQQLDAPGEIAVVLRGGQGTGKSFFARTYGSLFGRHFQQVSDPKHLIGSFNAHLQDCCVLLGDEAFFAGDKKHESVLKTLITERTLNIERKGIDVEQSANHIRLILASNNAWVVPADIDDRRFFALDVADTHAQDSPYFGAIAVQMNNGGREALLHELLNVDLSGWDVRERPSTRALQSQKSLSLRGTDKMIYELLYCGEAPAWTVEGESVFVRSAHVREKFGTQRLSLKSVGTALGRISVYGKSIRATANGKQRPGYWMLPLSAARCRWSESNGGLSDWPDDDGQWSAVEVPGEPY